MASKRESRSEYHINNLLANHAATIKRQWLAELAAKQRQESIDRRQQRTLKRSLRNIEVQEILEHLKP